MSFDIDEFISPDCISTEKQEEKIKLPGLFDYINDLSFKKENLAKRVKEEIGVFPSEFVPYITIKAFGNYKDTVFLANMMNINFNYIPNDAQYMFYLYSVPKKKRFAKFYSVNSERETKIKALAKYFHWGSREAEANLKMFSTDEINEIIKKTQSENQVNKISK